MCSNLKYKYSSDAPGTTYQVPGIALTGSTNANILFFRPKEFLTAHCSYMLYDVVCACVFFVLQYDRSFHPSKSSTLAQELA